MKYVRCGKGDPLLLVHGLGTSWRVWMPIWDELSAEREVIAIDLPGFGATPPLSGPVSLHTLADAVADFIDAEGLRGIDAVGNSMGGQIVLELARRGNILGGVVALDPGGFWRGWERHTYYAISCAIVRIVRLLQPILPWLSHNLISRTLLFAPVSARPWSLSPNIALEQLRSYVGARSFDEAAYALCYDQQQKGMETDTALHPLVIGWGRRDRICFPIQAERACESFPDACLHWFEQAGHIAHWDSPQEVVRLILGSLDGSTNSV